MVSTRSIALIASATAVTGALGYCVYFDYRRRNDPAFRRSIRKQQKQVKAAAEAATKAEAERNNARLHAIARELETEPLPTSPEQMEAFFQEQVAEGEALAAKGPDSYIEAASHFYRALKVYPQPVELLMIYQRVCPKPVFDMVIQLTTMTAAGASATPQTLAGAMGVGAPPSATAAATATPAPAPPTAADVDESGPEVEAEVEEKTAETESAGTTSEWERVSEEAKA